MSIEKYQHGGSCKFGWMEETQQSFTDGHVAHVNTGGGLTPMRNTTFLHSEKDLRGKEVITFEHDRQIKQSLVTFKDLQ